jgi:hypothetical protein
VKTPWDYPLNFKQTYVLKQYPTSQYQKTLDPSGQILYVPLNTDQCWNLPLPCAPEVPKNQFQLKTLYGFKKNLVYKN